MTNTDGDRALSAAVRLALGGALFVAGCGGTVSREPGREGEARSDVPSQDVSVAQPGAPTGSTVASPAPPAGTTLDGCKSKLRAAFGDDAGARFFDPVRPLVADPALVACCDAIAASEPDATTHLRAVGCCNVDVPSNGRHCTPWGPPTPPAFVRRAVEVA